MCRPALKSDFNCSIQKAGVTFRELKRPSIHSGGDAGVNGISAKIKSYRVKYEDQGEICFLKTGCSCTHLEWSLSNLLLISLLTSLSFKSPSSSSKETSSTTLYRTENMWLYTSCIKCVSNVYSCCVSLFIFFQSK